MARLVAIDYGRARIGIATTDPLQKIALPYKTLKTLKSSEATAQLLVKELQALHPIETIIIGLPLELSGKEGIMAKEVKVFAELLAKFTPLPLTFWDERLTSQQADKSLRALELNRKERSRLVDTTAACHILQCFLDASLK